MYRIQPLGPYGWPKSATFYAPRRAHSDQAQFEARGLEQVNSAELQRPGMTWLGLFPHKMAILTKFW